MPVQKEIRPGQSPRLGGVFNFSRRRRQGELLPPRRPPEGENRRQEDEADEGAPQADGQQHPEEEDLEELRVGEGQHNSPHEHGQSDAAEDGRSGLDEGILGPV